MRLFGVRYVVRRPDLKLLPGCVIFWSLLVVLAFGLAELVKLAVGYAG